MPSVAPPLSSFHCLWVLSRKDRRKPPARLGAEPRPHLSAPPSYRAGGAAREGEGRASQLGPAEAKFAGAQATPGWHIDGLSQEQQPRVAWGWCLASGAHVSAVTWKSVALKGVTYSWQGSRRT